jgi:hypothetical protein
LYYTEGTEASNQPTGANTMNTKQAKIVAALQTELAAAEATKAAALLDLTAEEVFYSACDRIRALQEQIAEASMTRRAGYRCPNTAALVAANID